METLMDSTDGRFRVTTADSSYLIDPGLMVIRRALCTEDADGALLRRDDELVTVLQIVRYSVRQSMQIIVDLHVLGVPCTARTTTPVKVVVELEPSFQIKPEEAFELWWNANHHYAIQRVRGGWSTVRLLIGSVDGAGWPWTTIEYRTEDAYRWIQVLGTPTCMTLEVGGGRRVCRVGRAAQDRGARVPMPQECQWWVVAVWDNQTFTADEAYPIARTFLSRGLLADEWSLEEIFYLGHRSQ